MLMSENSVARLQNRLEIPRVIGDERLFPRASCHRSARPAVGSIVFPACDRDRRSPA